MLKKLRMTTFAAVLCLFGFVLVPAAPVYASEQAAIEAQFKKCVKKGIMNVKVKKMKKTMKCFKKVAAAAIKKSGDVCGKTWNKKDRSGQSLFHMIGCAD